MLLYYDTIGICVVFILKQKYLACIEPILNAIRKSSSETCYLKKIPSEAPSFLIFAILT